MRARAIDCARRWRRLVPKLTHATCLREARRRERLALDALELALAELAAERERARLLAARCGLAEPPPLPEPRGAGDKGTGGDNVGPSEGLSPDRTAERDL